MAELLVDVKLVAEVSFTLPGHDGFTPISSPDWETFLADPFAASLPPFAPPLPPELQTVLVTRVGPGSAATTPGWALRPAVYCASLSALTSRC
jgi:hypothetical protein